MGLEINQALKQHHCSDQLVQWTHQSPFSGTVAGFHAHQFWNPHFSL